MSIKDIRKIKFTKVESLKEIEARPGLFKIYNKNDPEKLYVGNSFTNLQNINNTIFHLSRKNAANDLQREILALRDEGKNPEDFYTIYVCYDFTDRDELKEAKQLLIDSLHPYYNPVQKQEEDDETEEPFIEDTSEQFKSYISAVEANLGIFLDGLKKCDALWKDWCAANESKTIKTGTFYYWDKNGNHKVIPLGTEVPLNPKPAPFVRKLYSILLNPNANEVSIVKNSGSFDIIGKYHNASNAISWEAPRFYQRIEEETIKSAKPIMEKKDEKTHLTPWDVFFMLLNNTGNFEDANGLMSTETLRAKNEPLRKKVAQEIQALYKEKYGSEIELCEITKPQITTELWRFDSLPDNGAVNRTNLTNRPPKK